MSPNNTGTAQLGSKGVNEKDSCYFGDVCDNKKSNTVRVMFQNINGFGYSHDSVKAQSIRKLMVTSKVDVMALAELNMNWGKLSRAQTLPQICKRWFQSSKATISYNQHERRKKNKHQPGGTAVISLNDLSLRHHKHDYDTKKLGRWASQAYQGKGGIITRVVSVYVPIIMKTHGHKKVSCQQQRALLHMGVKSHYIKVFFEDFWKQIDVWLEQGDQLIVAGDWNNDIRKKKFLENFTKRNLIPAIHHVHGNELPPTYNEGSKPIDEIFVSTTLKINACGYLPHGSSLGDHCPVWVDLNRDTVLGVKGHLKPIYQARKLKTQDPRIVEKYNNTLHDLLESKEVLERTRFLANSISGRILKWQIDEYEELDKIREESMKVAEKKCRKLKMGAVKWSPELQLARDTITYYSLTLRKKLGRKVSTKIIYRLSKKVNRNATNLSKEELKLEVDKAYKQYKLKKKKHWKLRDEFLSDLAEALEKRGKTKKSTIVKNLTRMENQRSMYRKLAAINKKNADLSTKYIVTTNNGVKTTISKKEDMEKAIIKENIHKYHQTESTCPFMHDPLKNHFGDFGIGPASEQLLAGTYIPPANISEQTKDYIELCRLPKGKMIINPLTRSLDYYNDSWKKMKEKTASRELHFGHFKAATYNQDLMEIHYNLAEVPFRSGYSPSRWRNATNVMILKKEGNHELDKLRTLVLFEADFNHNNKFLGRKMMHHMIDNEFLAQEQYSSPGKKCIDHVINRRLFFDHIRYKKTGAAMSAVDLKSCYDRIAHAPAMLAMRSYGIPASPLASMFATIQDMQYYTFTFHGMSDRSFGGRDRGYTAKPNGMGQGNGAGPPVWSVVSSKMFEVMHKRGAATKIISPITAKKTEICEFAYVDDTDLIASTNNNNEKEITDRMQNILNNWEAVSKTTGGALVPSKCWSWIIQFDWKNDLWTYSDTASSTKFPMTITDASGMEQALQKLDSSTAKEMLGVFLAPDGNNSQQIDKLTTKMKMLAEYIRTGHVSRYEAWTSLTLIAMKTLEYSLPALSLSKKEYQKIMSPVLKYFLPKSGLNRNIKRDILYAPLIAQGFDLHDPYIIQGSHHIKDIVEHCWKNTLTGELINSNLEQMRIEIGVNSNIFELDYKKYKSIILTNSYVLDTWKFCSEYGITFKDNTPEIPNMRKFDRPIMEVVLSNKNISDTMLHTVNRCRIYLKAFTISDITSSCGKFITSKAWHGRIDDTGRDTTNWPSWGRPSLTSWTTWRTVLQLCFANNDRRLYNPLGAWIKEPSNWTWYMNKISSHLYKKDKSTWTQYKRTGRSKLTHKFTTSLSSSISTIQETLLPTTVVQVNNYIIASSTSPIEVERNPVSLNTTTWLNIEECSKGNRRAIKTALITGSALAVSDGSYMEIEGVGTASWIITDGSKNNFITASAVSPGPPQVQNSYRSELVGILGVLEKLESICREEEIKGGMCLVACDGLSAIKQISNLNLSTVHTRLSSCDIISACIKLINVLPIKIEFGHVKGHQDESISLDELAIPAQLNVFMDDIAKELARRTTSEDLIQLPHHKYSFSLPNVASVNIHEHLQRNIAKTIGIHKANKYWIQKGRIKEEHINCINWKAQEKALYMVKGQKRRTITKWTCGWTGTGKNMKRWNLRYEGYCPFCKYENEDTSHILQCQHDHQNSLWKKLNIEYESKLQKLQTNFYLRRTIMREIEAWRKKYPPPPLHYADSQLIIAIKEQRELGWKAFLEGLISKKIIDYQQKYYTETNSKLSIKTWCHRTIRYNWKLILELWDSRNKYIQRPSQLELMEGLPLLDKAIEKEWEYGLGKLPILEFSPFFRIKKHTLIKKSTEGKKDWLANVKLARKLYEDETARDEFDDNQALRDWIGLEE